MKAEKVMAAIGKISDKYIEENAVVKPVRQNKANQIVDMKWFIRSCACLAVFVLAVGVEIPLLAKGPHFASYNLNAYRMADDDN